MFIFFWILASMGVAYGAKISGRNAFWWFVLAIALSPLIGAAALWIINRRRPA
jgi:hypothetical protein